MLVNVVDEKKLNACLSYAATLEEAASYCGVTVSEITTHIHQHHEVSYEDYKTKQLHLTSIRLKQKAIDLALSGNVKMLEMCLNIISDWNINQPMTARPETVIRLAYSLDDSVDVTPIKSVKE